jgi:thiamine phosphate synthase YjbQ (UPF0047 family)
MSTTMLGTTVTVTHVRASLVGPSLTIPFINSDLVLISGDAVFANKFGKTKHSVFFLYMPDCG